ncbi:MAG: PilT/PilU family type 4a pilus ATPase [Planctomycetota bacterium]
MAENGKEIDALLRLVDKYKASDLHIKTGAPPMLRIATNLRPLEMPPITHVQAKALAMSIMSEDQQRRFGESGSYDLAYGLEGVGRFRVNIFRQRGSVSMAIRRVTSVIPRFEELHLPPKPFEKIAEMEQGLVIVSGITGSGKSTSLASVIDYINERRRCHIVTIEDPIEYLHRDKKAFVNQREVGIDVVSFKDALRYVVRQDPDVILVGEMRDEETFQTALTAAETGHLVFGTLHSSTAPQTFGRILDLFTADRQDQIRQGLTFNLKAIVCQKLLPSIKPGVRLVPSVEILFVNSTVQKLIRERKDAEIAGVLRAGKDEGMQDFNQSLLHLVKDGFVARDVAMSVSPNPDALEMNLKGIFLAEDRRIIS